MDSPLLRHFASLRTADLRARLPVRIGVDAVGWMRPAHAALLDTAGAGAVVFSDGAALTRAADRLEAAGVVRRRGEAFDVRARPGGPVLGQLDRGFLPAFGVAAAGVHLNGLVEQGNSVSVWVGRRARDKLLDPGKLDHLAAGGVPAGLGPRETLEKEAGEEAGITPALVAGAREVGQIAYAMERPEGLRRDVLHCYDLFLPPDFEPRPHDGEVEGFELWPLDRALHAVRGTDRFKFNVNVVLIDLFLRRGLLHGEEARQVRLGLDALRPLRQADEISFPAAMR